MTNQSFRVRRTCTYKTKDSIEQKNLENYRDKAAYVLLGDPGAGKTEAFKLEAKESGGEYITARDFAVFEPKDSLANKTLFIDGLDEMRADGGDGRTPLDHIRNHLERLGCPRFRLSCREADWLGASDSEALKRVSPDGEIVALHLDPLSKDDIIEILRHKPNVPDPNAFMRKAQKNRLDELMSNPQTLNLLVEALGGDRWPQSRKEVYEMACRQLVREENAEHRQAKRDNAISVDTLLDAAGYLCAVQLLSGIAGFALDEAQADDQHACWKELLKQDPPILSVLKTNLFHGDGEELRIPVHRSVAEFLGARYLASCIEQNGLPFGRMLALMAGSDGGIVTDLRGLAAWLAVHCFSGRRTLIERDPLGIVLYGDVRHFPMADKQFILETLRNEAQRNPWLHSDDWSSSSFGALATQDMEPALHEILISSSRDEADQVLLSCALDAIRYGEPLPALIAPLESIVRDSSYHRIIRTDALQAWIRNVPEVNPGLLQLAQDIRDGIVEDRDDELLGIVLKKLYPQAIPPAKIFDYLHSPKNKSLIGGYFVFWSHHLPERTPKEILPALLDTLIQVKPDIQNLLKEHQLNPLAGNLLVRGLKEYGDAISNECLYDWLGIGLDEYGNPRFDNENAGFVATWLANRSERYKAVIEIGASRCINQEKVWSCMNSCMERLYWSRPPAGIEKWYLEKAAMEQHSGLAEFYFTQAVVLLKRQGNEGELTLSALEFLESWVKVHLNFQPLLEPYITCPLEGWQQELSIKNRKNITERQQRRNERMRYYRQHIATIRDGSVHPKILHDLSSVYEGRVYEAQGETPRERLEHFLDGDHELIEAAYTGFRRVLDRPDLPSVSELIDLNTQGRMPFIGLPCLVGMNELFRKDPAGALRLDDTVLSRLLAFRLTYNIGENPAWFKTLIREHPALAAEVLTAYALAALRAGKEYVSGLHALANNDAYIEVARIALPKLLEGFPLRARKSQLTHALVPLLKGAFHYLDRTAFAALIAGKVAMNSMDAAQRMYWLSCGLLLAPDVYETQLFRHIGKSATRRGHLAGFLYSDHGERRLPEWVLPSETTLARLIELLAPDCPPRSDEKDGWVSDAMQTAGVIRSYISTLGSNPGESAGRELERLLTLPKLMHWRNQLRSALHSQRIARRKASFRRLSIREIDLALANRQPASTADLAALTFNHLRDIAQKIRNGNTDDYQQYWSYDENNKALNRSKPENDCRDALLSDLRERLGKFNIDAQREGSYADDKRADIRVSFGGTNGFNIPIEIKKDSHSDLWRSIHEQLIQKYTRDPGTDGHGIYLVFWFGGKGMPLPIDGSKKPRTVQELEDRLRQTLSPEENHRIQICVIDCALPQM